MGYLWFPSVTSVLPEGCKIAWILRARSSLEALWETLLGSGCPFHASCQVQACGDVSWVSIPQESGAEDRAVCFSATEGSTGTCLSNVRDRLDLITSVDVSSVGWFEWGKHVLKSYMMIEISNMCRDLWLCWVAVFHMNFTVARCCDQEGFSWQESGTVLSLLAI